MKLQFESGLKHQQLAIDAVVDVFEGQPQAAGTHELLLDELMGELWSDLGVGNRLVIDDDTLLANVRSVQVRNGLDPSPELQGHDLTIEMETGTGKTYVYLRTIYELYQRYGFKKFVIVVPSVAIKEGLRTAIDLTQEHFEDLYDGLRLNASFYDSREMSIVRQFAASADLEVLAINIDAFNKKDISVIRRPADALSGRAPIEFIQAAAPIVILDEPQNMVTPNARDAIASLNPLVKLRYSATHIEHPNLVYRLDPVQAFDQGLVKGIDVHSVTEDSDFNRPYIRVVAIKTVRNRPTAVLEIDLEGARGTQRRKISVSDRSNRDLFLASRERELYRGLVVDEIDSRGGTVEITGRTLRIGEIAGAHPDDIMRAQVRETVRAHLRKELSLSQLPLGQRIKVLSLFFIDRVANYYPADGKIRLWFVDAYNDLSRDPAYASLALPDVSQVHRGYFACVRDVPKDTSGNTNADDDAFELIMVAKERLLSREEPVRFVFSHSALREGWDNPNVFQICTLLQTQSELRKRQVVGRGLRLPVNENGERVRDEQINRLTVIANESYDSFAKGLQDEMRTEFGVEFGDRVRNQRDRLTANLRAGWDTNPHFIELWNRIRTRTQYSVHLNSEELIDAGAAAIRNMPSVETARIRIQSAEIGLSAAGVEAVVTSARSEELTPEDRPIPDVLGFLQERTLLTRKTLAQMVARSSRLEELPGNPQKFLEFAARAIQQVLLDQMVDGVRYEALPDDSYELTLFRERIFEFYASRSVAVPNSLYDVVETDSGVERQFAAALGRRSDIKLFLKLPRWFRIDTPLGGYIPDWAIVKADGQIVYLVRETKGTTDFFKLARAEQHKISCGKKHFATLGVDYNWVKSADDV